MPAMPADRHATGDPARARSDEFANLNDTVVSNFSSPWRRRLFRAGVAGIRRLLRLVHVPEEGFIRWLVNGQNRRVHDYLRRHPAETILLIMPRCLKRKGCPVDVKGALATCLTCDCRDCPLAQVARLTEECGVKALVAFRSHIAFQMARREMPDLIIATACDDRLIKALNHVPEIPALLSPLTGMRRPCIDATIDLPWLEDQLAQVSKARTIYSRPTGRTALAAASGSDDTSSSWAEQP
jgi:hypothetical protein